jgi:hypothetical protein
MSGRKRSFRCVGEGNLLIEYLVYALKDKLGIIYDTLEITLAKGQAEAFKVQFGLLSQRTDFLERG